MTTTQSAKPRQTDARRLESLALELVDCLDRMKRSLDQEIRTYPTPITRCDAQFNHLYEQRTRLAGVLEQVLAALDRPDTSGALVHALAGFSASPPLGESAREQGLRQRLREALAATN